MGSGHTVHDIFVQNNVFTQNELIKCKNFPEFLNLFQFFLEFLTFFMKLESRYIAVLLIVVFSLVLKTELSKKLLYFVYREKCPNRFCI